MTRNSGVAIDEHNETQEFRRNRRRAVAAAGLGWGLDGFTWTMYGFALTAALPVLGMTTASAGWVTALSVVASAMGGLIFGNLADRFGRTRILTVVIIGYALFTGLTATSQNEWQFLTWRILEGLFFGGEWAVGAALVAEYARARSRGRLLAFVQSTYAIGWVVSTGAYLLVFTLAPPQVAWRYLFLVGILPAIAAVFIRLTTKDAVPVGHTSHRQRARLADLLAPTQRRKTVFATLLGVGVQGIYYSVFVFLPTFLKQERGLTVVGTATYTWLAVVGAFIGYLTAGWFLDFLGRRLTFFSFFVGSVGSLLLFILTPAASQAWQLVIIFLLGFFASGQAGGTGAYLSELFPTHIRATGQALAYNVGRGIAAFGPLTVGLMAASLTLGGAILLVGIIGATLGCIALLLLPETKNQEIVDPGTREETSNEQH